MKHRSYIHTDIVIVGSGVAGLFAALCLPESKKILMITKEDLKECDSYLAQGGVCVLKSLDDFKCFYEDTMKAGHYENVNVDVQSQFLTLNAEIGEESKIHFVFIRFLH